MSNTGYHRASELLGAKHDWTTTEGVAAGLRGELELEGYGAKFQIFRDGAPLDEGRRGGQS